MSFLSCLLLGLCLGSGVVSAGGGGGGGGGGSSNDSVARFSPGGGSHHWSSGGTQFTSSWSGQPGGTVTVRSSGPSGESTTFGFPSGRQETIHHGGSNDTGFPYPGTQPLPPTAVAVSPAVSLSVSPTTALPGQPITLTWSTTNATACTASGVSGWSGSKATGSNNSEIVTVPTAAADVLTYQLRCTGGVTTSPAQDEVSVNVTVPTVRISVSRDLVRQGQVVDVLWSITPEPAADADLMCSIGGAGNASFITTDPSGQMTSNPINNLRRISLDCSIYGIQYLDEVLVSVIPGFSEI